MLRACTVTVTAGKRHLLDNFSMHCAVGELVMVVGPNGAGKTTLLRCLNGELTPAKGEIEFTGINIRDWKPLDLARHRAVLPQHSALDFPFSVTDVVLMGRMPHPTSESENRRIADEVLGACDCQNLGARAYTSLSGGEQQRVQIARVLAQIFYADNAPAERFLLLDEPVSALDLSHQYALLRLLKKLSRGPAKIGIVCTLHNLNLVAQFADRAVVMDGGMLVADGEPMAVFTEETVSNVFDLDVAVRGHPDDAGIPLLLPRLGC